MHSLRSTLVLFALLATACGTTSTTDAGATPDSGSAVDSGGATPDSGTPRVDSGGMTPDSGTPLVDSGGTTTDAGPGVCTGQLYDPCNRDVSGFCSTGNCHAFPELSACTQPCSTDSPCPDQAGVAVRCNVMGLCQPDVPNGCLER